MIPIVWREILEQRRQPGMLATVWSLMLLVGGAGPIGAAAVGWLAGDPDGERLLASLVPELGPAEAVSSLLAASVFLTFTQYLGVGAVMAGHGLLHDRQCGTFTFLLLAPVSRRALLAGKVLGALAWPTAFYLATAALCGGVGALTPYARAHAAASLPLSVTWWVVVGLAGPAWAAFVGTICAGISALARDVRAAQQGTWFVVFFASLLAGGVLTWALGQSPAEALGAAGVAFAGAALALGIGADLLARDLGR